MDKQTQFNKMLSTFTKKNRDKVTEVKNRRHAGQRQNKKKASAERRQQRNAVGKW
ncbi:hypothetical protein ACFPYJ_01605 [Paenibacillus solisilvae]|uniref:DUF4023 domain-containing protein n=1 Tax=Paenibacillus solisilvae TaxID=2486751 RepID=A0ABW0VUF9_9BACL